SRAVRPEGDVTTRRQVRAAIRLEVSATRRFFRLMCARGMYTPRVPAAGGDNSTPASIQDYVLSSTPVPPTAAKIESFNSLLWFGILVPAFPVVKSQGFFAWNTVRASLGHGACPTGAWCVTHWGMVRAPLGHGACPTGARSVSHWGTVGVPLGHGACPTGAWCVSHWGTVR